MSKKHIALTYDDIQLIPQYSTVSSRSLVNLTTNITKNYSLDIPILASCMDTICEDTMALVLNKLGGAGIIHRFNSIEDQYLLSKKVVESRSNPNLPVCAAIGVTGDYLERAQALDEAGVNVLVIDVAHGYHLNVNKAISKIKLSTNLEIIAGSIADNAASIALEDWGADGLRVGIGNGSICSTRVQTGFGVPSVTSIIECSKNVSIPVIADGGIKSSGDIAKAIAVGANAVMLGSMLAGSSATPGNVITNIDGQWKRYRGLASSDTKLIHGQSQRNIEGVSTMVRYKGDTEDLIKSYLDGIRSALSYGGASTIEEFQENVDWYQVTYAGHIEGTPHILK